MACQEKGGQEDHHDPSQLVVEDKMAVGIVDDDRMEERLEV